MVTAICSCRLPPPIQNPGLLSANRNCDSLRQFCCEIIDYTPYRPDLTPKDFRPFGYIKNTCLARDLQQTLTWNKLSLGYGPMTLYCAAMHALVQRCNTCWGINVCDDYVEVWCLPSDTHIPYVNRKQNESHGFRVFVTLTSESALFMFIVCVCVSVCVCVYVCMYVIYVRRDACMCVIYVHIYACMRVCMYVRT